MSASYQRKYATGSGADIYINIPKAGSANHAVSGDWSPAAGDVKVSIDGGAAANIGTLPTAIAMGNSASWKFVFTDAELTGKFIHVTVADSATKAVDDTGFTIETYGHASALHPFDLSAVNPRVLLADSASHGGSAAVITLERLVAASTTSNEPAFKLTGNGSAAGLRMVGGATGPGAFALGAAFGFRAQATDGIGFAAEGTTYGAYIDGQSVGMRIRSTGSSHGLDIIGNNGANQNGINISGFGKHGINIAAGAAGVGINLDTLTASGDVTLSGAVTANNAGNSITGVQLAAAGIAGVWANLIETGVSAENALKAILAVCGGLASGFPGAGDKLFSNAAGTKVRVTSTTDADGNRSAITYDFS